MENVLRSLEEKILSSYKLNSLAKAFERISDRYRKGSGSFLQTQEERWVYLLTRLPATFAASLRVCQEIRNRKKDLVIETIQDVGAGPGAGLWAVAEVFEMLTKATLVEKDLDFLRMGKEIAAMSSQNIVQQAVWHCEDMTRVDTFEPHDLTILSYSIGEIPEHFPGSTGELGSCRRVVSQCRGTQGGLICFEGMLSLSYLSIPSPYHPTGSKAAATRRSSESNTL